MADGKHKGAVATKLAPEQETSSHISVHPLYTPADLEGWDYDRDLNFPGQFPYTRGVQATMYRGRLWTMRQYAGMGDAEESNRRYKYLLSNGTTGLSVAFDLPTQIGLDSDNPLAMGEVGKVGVAIDSIEDMMRLFDGIDLEKISTSMTINATASILLALYIVTARRTGRDVRKLSGTVQNDVLKEYIARGTYIYPPAQAMRIITDIFSYAHENVPEWNTISISGYHMREAGCTAVQEVAFTLANGISYVQAAIDAGLSVDDFRAAAVVLLQRAQQFSGGGGEVSRRPPHVGAHHARPFRRQKSKIADVALPHPNRRFDAYRAAAREQHRTHRIAGHGGGNGRDPIAAHQFLRRSPGLAHRTVGPHRPPDAADHRLRIRCAADRRSAGGFVLHRIADQPDRDSGARVPRQDRRHGRHPEGHRARIHSAGNPKRRLRVSARRGQSGKQLWWA